MIKLVPSILEFIGKIFPDKEKLKEAEIKLYELAQNGELKKFEETVKLLVSQAEINKAEAMSGDKYASRWRPTIGYLCAMGLGYNFVIYPLLQWAIVIFDLKYSAPPLFSENLQEIIMGMLGLASLRTWEKVKK